MIVTSCTLAPWRGSCNRPAMPFRALFRRSAAIKTTASSAVATSVQAKPVISGKAGDGLPRRSFAGLSLTAAALSLPGCKLVDQRTFDHTASRPPKVIVPPPPPGPPPVPPLVEVIAGTPVADWQGPLEAIVKRALARKPNILFRVQALAPPGADADADRATLARLTTNDGQAVANAIVAGGASPAQIEMTAMPNSGVASPRIRVYVR
ncbi:hypothetical protein [Acetobacter nitrogenifigens]|nr:hypothetical protein [Acetobacter nitrogenifigens]